MKVRFEFSKISVLGAIYMPGPPLSMTLNDKAKVRTQNVKCGFTCGFTWLSEHVLLRETLDQRYYCQNDYSQNQ